MSIKIIQRISVLMLTLLAVSNVQAMEAVKVASGLHIPWGLTYVDDNTMLISQRDGVIKQLDLKTGKHETLLKPANVWAQGQGGLLDIALSPFEANKIYLTYSKDVNGEGATTLAQASYKDGKLSDWQDLFISASRTDTGRHFGSRIAFDNNSLYFSIGDRGVRDNGQDTLTHAGSILRLKPDGSTPSDNPFVGNEAVLDEIWSYGHRNPQGLFFDAQSQKLWSIEHGPRGGDEINLIKRGANYGWPVTSHGKEYWGPMSVGEGKLKEGIEPPVKVYVPSIAPGSLVLYRGDKFPELNGKLLAGALKLTHINVVTINDAGKAVAEQRIMSELGERIRDIEVSPQGDIYFSTDSGNLYRLKQ
ncbi:PQQ-dependent sugar dehydrogenase [Shewanella sp. Isolate13]|uniref:PQQ-dependent sugar dehydrogenase n=1 Tax=Shewanella sp. Isolate13 TaxID=2908531 RepID=UPI001EFD7674|nr:PQQ-dependent sugar dehydrogenase [Shewanella sp. Isolate13]MCG9730628.1 PQQ-dependent sugar dehydrogenase [Shewanella sp. Isolate13]